MTIGKKWVCYGCPDHAMLCHSSCDRYLAEKAALAEEITPAKQRNAIVNEYIADSVKQTRGSGGQLIRKCRPKGREL